jgi:hypothetical protein
VTDLAREAGRWAAVPLGAVARARHGRLLPVPRRDTVTSYCSIMGYRADPGVLRFAVSADGEQAPSEPAPLAAAVRRAGLGFSLQVARGLGP